MVVLEASAHDPKKKHGWSGRSASMFPLRLSHAMTTWKAQGQIISGQFAAACLSTLEKEHDLVHAAFLHATVPSNVGIIGGLSCKRL
jgi:hypothetical protein